MLTATLKVVFNAENDTGATTRTDKAVVAIVGQPVDACGWYGGMRELMWNDIPFEDATHYTARIAEVIDTPCSVELTTSDPEKWANASFSDAENLLTYKAVRAAVKAGDLIFSTEGTPVSDNGGETDFPNTEAYEPGKHDPPSDQHPA